MATEGISDGGFVGGVDLEGVCDALRGDFERLFLVTRDGAVGGRCSEEVDDGKCESLFRFGCLLGRLAAAPMWTNGKGV